jgi:sugar phosphate permease
MSTSSSAWRSYRRRRNALVIGLVVGGLVIGLAHVANASSVVMLMLCAIVGFEVFISGLLLSVFACPACKHDWFGTREPRYGQLAILLELASQKVCNNCGLPKFMEPHHGPSG